ncbi:MAG: dipeptidase [Planctomycetota bacterium]|jgi:membrane dipeptidase
MNDTHDFLDRAQFLHEKAIVIDTHCDTTQRLRDDSWNFTVRHDDGHVDLPRIREGGLDAVFFAVFAAGPLPPGAGTAAARQQIECLTQLPRRYPEHVALAQNPADILAACQAGKLAALIAIEGGYLMDNSIAVLEEFRRAGAMYMTLTHGFHTDWADSSGIFEPLAPRHGGLTDFGREVIRAMNRLDLMVDVSHVSDDTVRQVLEISKKPVIASHSSCRAVSNHPRNLSDDLMRDIAATGGLVQINFAAGFIDPHYPEMDPKTLENRLKNLGQTHHPPNSHVTPLSVLADHFEHAINVIGYEHVGIGSDFDGVPHLPDGMPDCSQLPNLTAELLRRGHAEHDLEKVLGSNVLRLLGDGEIP